MPKKVHHHIWHKQKFAKDYQEVDCPASDPYKDFALDPTGYYVLIRLDFNRYCIEVGICDKRHNVVKLFRGKTPQDIYTAIFRYEKRHNLIWFKEKTHIAYLGKELKKAEIALATGNSAYFQE